jgi:hypothetical protein
MKFRKQKILALAVALSGCAWRQTPVPLTADARSLDLLTGSWAGDYTSVQTGRTGSITFELVSEDSSAYGDIVMLARPRDPEISQTDRRPAVPIIRPVMEPLKIRFVRAESGRITGTLDPYKDPDCGCTLITTFQGEFTSRNRIEGTFFSRGDDIAHVPAEGKWSVTRQKPGTR